MQWLRFDDEKSSEGIQSCDDAVYSLYGSDSSTVADRKIAALEGRITHEKRMFSIRCEHLVDYLDDHMQWPKKSSKQKINVDLQPLREGSSDDFNPDDFAGGRRRFILPLEEATNTAVWPIGRWIYNQLHRLDGRRCRLNGGVNEMRALDVKKLQHIRDIQAYALRYIGEKYMPSHGSLFISKRVNGQYKCKSCLKCFDKQQVKYNRCQTCRMHVGLVKDRLRKQKKAESQKQKLQRFTK